MRYTCIHRADDKCLACSTHFTKPSYIGILSGYDAECQGQLVKI